MSTRKGLDDGSLDCVESSLLFLLCINEALEFKEFIEAILEFATDGYLSYSGANNPFEELECDML